jgi:hypothetical protein
MASRADSPKDSELRGQQEDVGHAGDLLDALLGAQEAHAFLQAEAAAQGLRGGALRALADHEEDGRHLAA